MSRPFILRPVATSLLMIAILLVGLVAYRQLPVSALPQVDYPTIQVLTFYPGAGPEVMATSVTAPLERQFGQLPGLSQMTSSSSSGCSVVTLQFSLSLSIDVAEQEVQQAINSAGTYLPKDLPNPPVYTKINPADAPVLTLALTSTTLPLPQVEDLADTRLAQKISQVNGVGLVSISGGQKPAVRIRANPVALAQMGITLDDLRTALGAANVNQAKGSLDGKRQLFTIGANDQLLSSAEYRPIIIAYRNGSPVRLSDVAEVVDAAENDRQAAWMDRTPAVILNVQRQPGANTIETVRQIKRILPQLQDTLPASIKLDILTDRTVTIQASVDDVQFELILCVALVVAVIFVFLRNVPATLIPAAAVPLSLVGTFGVMYLLGYSLNNLTLMALTISTGFVVDDAIVMIENIARYVEEGENPLQAALKGASQIGFTILSLTVSLIAVLIPLLFMGDIVGRLFREFAVTLSVTIVISAVVSLTLTPMMCARLLKHSPESGKSWFYRISERGFDAVLKLYEVTLRVVLRARVVTLLVAVGTLVATAMLYVAIPKGFFPVQDTGLIIGITDAPQSISFPAMADRQQALVAAILRDPAIDRVSSFIGIDGTNTTLNAGRIQINLKPLDQRDATAPEIIRRLNDAAAKVTGISLYMQPVQDLTVEDRTSRTLYQYSLECPDAKLLADFAPRFVTALSKLPELADVATDAQNYGLQTQLIIDRDAASRYGVTLQQIDDALYNGLGQRQVSTMFTQLNQYHVVLEVPANFRDEATDLGRLYVRSASNGQVPLSALARFEETTGPLTINRQGQFPVVTVSFNLAPGASLGQAVTAVNRARDELNPPASIQAGFLGTARAFEASLTNTNLLILAAVITVYIVLGVLYESYIHPITILSTLPSAAVGALLALMLCHEDFGVMALIGVVLLIGIVKKNAIMMIDFALEAQRNEGKPAGEAIFQACLLRFRPIMMTTAAALFGGLPLALGTGVGSELRRPLGITIVGGLILSQLLTLYTTPVIYLFFESIAERFRSKESRVASPELRGPEAPTTPA
jgi:multidrug efflux pump